MKKFTNCFVFIALFIFSASLATAQCTIDSTQTIPGVYPDTIAPAVANHPYSQDITFVMLTDTLGFTITNFQLAGITGLPLGITWVCNNAGNGCNYDPLVSLYGCINLSGLPLLAGTYMLDVTVVATLDGLGDQNINYPVPFTVLPDTVGNSGFSMINSSGCAPLTVTFTNNIPGQAGYLWDFGNTVTDTSENPGPQTYTVPGDYVVTQTVDPGLPTQYFLADVTVTEVPDNYNELGFLDPDPELYFLLTDTAGNTVYDSRPAINNTQPPYTWTLSSLSLGDQNYSLQVFDQDSLIVSLGDDDLGTVFIAGWGTSGSATDTIDGVNGQLDVSWTINQVTIPPIVSTDTVHVFPAPPVAVITGSGPLTFCEGDSVTLSSSASSGNQWYQGANILTAADTNQTYTTTVSGTYSVVVTSVNGCTSSSLVTTVVVNPLPPKPTIFAIGDTIFCALTGYSLQWYLNGAIIPGATQSYYVPLVDGTYSVVAIDLNGCSLSSDPLLFQGVGISESIYISALEISPNPSSGLYMLKFTNLKPAGYQLYITDLAGRNLYSETLNLVAGSYERMIDLTSMPSGIYLFEMRGEDFSVNRKLILNR